jgi:hypothetical protein
MVRSVCRYVAVAVFICFAGETSHAHAKSLAQLTALEFLIRTASDLDLPAAVFKDLFADPPHFVKELVEGEKALSRRYTQDYEDEQYAALVPLIGQPRIAGSYPYSSVADGQSTTVDFRFVDPNTLLPMASDVVTAVFYEVNLDPTTTDFVPLGTSSDASTQFALPFVVTGFEPLIRAIPLDASGTPVFMVGVDGSNVAQGLVLNFSIPVAEPPTFLSLLVGLAALAGLRRRKISVSAIT